MFTCIVIKRPPLYVPIWTKDPLHVSDLTNTTVQLVSWHSGAHFLRVTWNRVTSHSRNSKISSGIARLPYWSFKLFCVEKSCLTFVEYPVREHYIYLMSLISLVILRKVLSAVTAAISVKARSLCFFPHKLQMCICYYNELRPTI